MERLEAKIATLNRRARRLGCGEATLRVLSRQQQERSVYVIDMDSPRRERICTGTEMVETTTVEVEYPEEPVALAGWTFVARLTPLEGGGNIVAGGGESCPREYFTAEIGCDHCRTCRRRNDSFVVRYEDGRHKQIGRNCLADFVGDANAERTARYFEFVNERTEILSNYEEGECDFWEGGASVTSAYDLANVLALSIKYSPRYIGREAAYADQVMSTADIVRGAIADKAPTDDASEAEAEAVISQVLAMIPRGTADSYQHNLLALATAGYCTRKTIGLAVSMVPACRRMVAERDREERGARSQHIGVIGERIVIEGTIVGTWDKASNFGRRTTWTTVCFIRDDVDNMYVANNVGKKGDRVTIKATVKAHSEYRGVKQTQLSRPVLIETAQAA